MTSTAWLMGNLPESSWRDIPERTQELLRNEDEGVRLVWNACEGRYALVRKCDPAEGVIDVLGGYLTPGWRQFALLPHCDPHRLIHEMRKRDAWRMHQDRATSARMFAEDAASDFDVQSQKRTDDLMEQAHESSFDRVQQIGRYFGPKERHAVS